MKRKTLSAVLFTALAVSLTACSATGGSSESGVDDSLTSVQESGVLTVGTEGTYRPFSYHENGSGDLTGYDVEIVEAVAAELGVDASFQETQWDGIFAGLTSERFDVIANQVSMTPERIDAYDFSTPYTYSNGVIVVPADNTTITSFESLAGKTTAQSGSSNWRDLATESGATVEVIEGWAQSVALVEQGRVDATINDKLTFLDYEKNNDASSLKVAAETTEQSQSAFAFIKGSTALVTAVDEALATLAADGTLASISDTYFCADVSK